MNAASEPSRFDELACALRVVDRPPRSCRGGARCQRRPAAASRRARRNARRGRSRNPERRAEILALREDGPPAQARLKSLERTSSRRAADRRRPGSPIRCRDRPGIPARPRTSGSAPCRRLPRWSCSWGKTALCIGNAPLPFRRGMYRRIPGANVAQRAAVAVAASMVFLQILSRPPCDRPGRWPPRSRPLSPQPSRRCQAFCTDANLGAHQRALEPDERIREHAGADADALARPCIEVEHQLLGAQVDDGRAP